MNLKAAVITFPGSNCDDDCVDVLSRVCGFITDKLWHKDSPSLKEYHLVVLPGGFSYGDYLRCGAIAALSPIMESVKDFNHQNGLILGICNGFQLLCEAGLLPGALARNESLKFKSEDLNIKVVTNKSPWTCLLKEGDLLNIPIAHGDGRYVVTDEQYAKLKENDQIIFTYSSNPNGSCYDLAGVSNTNKNILGLMPHPERASDLRSKDGLKIFNSITKFLKERSI